MVIGADEIERVSTRVRALAASEVSGLTKDQLLEVNAAVARLERLVGAVGSRIAGEIARRSDPALPGGGLARREGFGNAGRMISQVRGASVSGAKRAIAAGDAFTPLPDAQRPKYPQVAHAQIAGDLSVDASGIIVTGLNSLEGRLEPGVAERLERRLVQRAMGMSAHDVQRMVTRAIARADHAEHERRERRNFEDRLLWWKQEHDGMVTFRGRLDSVTAAPIITVLEQLTTRDMRLQSRRDEGGVGRSDASGVASHPQAVDGDHRTPGQMRADALFTLARHALGCSETAASGVRTSLVVRMSLADLRLIDATGGGSGIEGAGGTHAAASAGADGAACESDTIRGLGSIDGIDQPVSVAELRRLAGDAGIIPEVLGADGEVLDLGRERRTFTRAQRVALLERDGGCARCHAPPEHCEAHHIVWWEHGGRSDLENGVMLCTRCHHDVHRQGWGIQVTRGQVSFRPPPTLDPARTPQLGGVAALDAGDVQLPVA
ncbi:DUF222 domain-containing protein [Demequina capsici]|uniref:DUF222 domain-containing protein n=1 Tax=Demequina capsici TaxID=3075620 RepID=A0AA96JD74_9MICO|nr:MULTISPECIES: DUF222 domain-containing protein [unclassified Demequina]WNM24374.1 DUF222 domain-containing protein [Demequina sp. OYTSA14]WNM27196.1 DUF222 domain-containing protein [Demequina sp. PMTSA13]